MRALPPPLGMALLALSCLPTIHAASPDPDPGAVSSALRRSADWQLANLPGTDKRHWVFAPLYDGLLRLSQITGEPRYLAELIRLGDQTNWTPGNRVYHADDHAVARTWVEIHRMDPSRKERLRPTQSRMDHILANPIKEALAFGVPTQTPGVRQTDRWTWCDALYMTPPTLVSLHAATGDSRYLEFMEQEFRYTHELLWDAEARLYYRDSNYKDRRTPNGERVFWSRGNGWVYGGLCLLMDQLPRDHPGRPFYESLFVEMTTAILASQQPDGLWYPSLHDAAQVPVGETSGSGFFAFGLAWGINQGVLDPTTHWPAVVRAWNGLLTRIREDGYVGYVQPIGAAPDTLKPESRHAYGTGAFLLAGCEILRALGADAKADPAKLLAAAERLLADEERDLTSPPR
jgi:unsaturated rhamnogalacturonyl hydrolase